MSNPLTKELVMRISPDGNKITMRQPDNLHAHFRQGDLAQHMVRLFEGQGWGRVLAMPNTRPPILNHADAVRYLKELESHRVGRASKNLSDLQFVMTMQINEQTTPQMIIEAVKGGVIKAGKIYPQNMTTHSENGVSLDGYEKLYPVFETAEKLGFRILFHGESPNSKVRGIDKEKAFLDIAENIVQKFWDLKIVLEHITTQAAVDFVRRQRRPNICATITVHHLALTLDDVIGYSQEYGYLMRPHNMCKPIAKFDEDKKALQHAAMSGESQFFYGGDDAPHEVGAKHCSGVCAGVFNTLEALPVLVRLFEDHGVIDRLEPFLSQYGAEFYGLPPNTGEISLVREDWVVPEASPFPKMGTAPGAIVPWLAGKTLPWKLV